MPENPPPAKAQTAAPGNPASGAGATDADDGVAGTRLSSLDNSLMHDLLRFDRVGAQQPGLEALEVMAAALRHARRLRVHAELDGRPVSLTVFPVQRLLHCPWPTGLPPLARLPNLRVLRVEPAQLPVPDDATAEHGLARQFAPLAPFVWALALHGSRAELLPEIAGNVAYRISPAAELNGLAVDGALAAALARLQQETWALRDIEKWPGLDRTRAQRLLNGLYLQAALMVSRSHPAATNEGWKGGKS